MKTIQEIFEYSEKIIPIIGLMHWKIKFSVKEIEEKIAEAKVQSKYRSAEILFNEIFFTLPQREQEEVIIHELLHCHLNFWVDTFDEVFIDGINYPRNQMTTVHNLIRLHEETAVELMARALHAFLEKDRTYEDEEPFISTHV